MRRRAGDGKRAVRTVKSVSPANSCLDCPPSAPKWTSVLEDLSRSPFTPVLVEGGSAAALGRTLHEMTFGGRPAPLVDVDCTWLPASAASRMIFGAELGGRIYRGFVERANGGTLILDDVVELPNEEQARVVTLLDSMCVRRHMGTECVPVRVRVVASVRSSASELAKNGRLRRDLHARLSVFPIVVSR
jgi:DNA-binding NtrC family response regulator